MKAHVLRKKYPRFIYKGYSYSFRGGNLHISFDFAVPPDITFRPRIIIKDIPLPKPGLGRRPKPGLGNLDNLVFHLGLMEIPSYWKATSSPEIVVQAGHLTKQQIGWWHDLIMKGMGEYFYKNKIDFTQPNFLKITSTQSLPKPGLGRRPKPGLGSNTLVPVGGGKDAVVTLELLKEGKQNIIPFLLNPKKEQEAILKIAGLKNPIIATRTIDPKLLELNHKGYLNGHTPFSAYLAFLSVLTATLFDYKYIALSNERSSNEGNVRYLGKIINHQYSKSFEFEKKFRQYSKKYLAKNIEYFSFLRPLYELQIARIFARYPKYFPAFLSCNKAHKTMSGARKPTGTWCRKCAKCLFVFTALYPFVQKGQLIQIFKKDLLEDGTLIPLVRELVGEGTWKPFECVGTKKESLVAFYLSLKKQKGAPPFLLIYFRDHMLPKYRTVTTIARTILEGWNNENFIPPTLAKLIGK